VTLYYCYVSLQSGLTPRVIVSSSIIIIIIIIIIPPYFKGVAIRYLVKLIFTN